MTETLSGAAAPVITNDPFVRFDRQHALLDPHRAAAVRFQICGCGTVGSNVAVQLARAGVGTIHLADMDTIEEHNMPSQAFSEAQIGVLKTVALHDQIAAVAGTTAVTTEGELSGFEVFEADYIGVFVDNMPMRRAIWEANKLNMDVSRIIDVRMGGMILQAWCVDPRNPEHVEKYEKKLWDASEVVPATCGTKTFAPVGALSGALVTGMVTADLSEDEEAESAPFYTYFDLGAFEMRAV